MRVSLFLTLSSLLVLASFATLAQALSLGRELDVRAIEPPEFTGSSLSTSFRFFRTKRNTLTGARPNKARRATKQKRPKTCRPKANKSNDGGNVAIDVGGGEISFNITKPAEQSSCFPAMDFAMPKDVPESLDGWWCNQQDEYAFLGFSYSTASCPSLDKIRDDFGRMRAQYKSRYVRIYSVCDRQGFNDDLITAAWENGLGLHTLLWFGFDGTDEWKGRKTELLKSMKGNPRAPYVVRAVVVGSEPLYDWALSPEGLTTQINDFKKQLEPWTNQGDTGMLVTLSDLAYGFQLHGDAPDVFKAVDVSEANVLPFLDPAASTAKNAMYLIKRDYKYFADHNNGKKVYFTQTGWPSNDSVFKANSKDAKATVQQEREYFQTLNGNCEWMKQQNAGGIGWFAHIWSDDRLPGWGIHDYNMRAKFDFYPRTSC